MGKFKTNIFESCKDGDSTELWLRARHYVLDILAPLDGDGIKMDSKDHVHVVLENTSDLMLAIARQIALIAHYANYDEENGKNRTVIAFCNCKDITSFTDKKVITKKLESQYFGNLLQFCQCTYHDASKENAIITIQKEKGILPLDIEFVFTTEDIDTYRKRTNPGEKSIDILEKNIPNDFSDYVDESKGKLVNMVYSVGQEIGNLPSSDNANISKYNIALNTFCYKLMVENIEEKWNKCNATDRLSSIFCADCFESRLRSILDINEKSLLEYLLTDYEGIMQEMCKEENITAFVKTEHARWNVEKLIMGFRPLNAEERYEDETHFGQEKTDYRKDWKKNSVHIDLCSYKDLRRVDIQNMKYDYFLMLAMPHILLASTKK